MKHERCDTLPLETFISCIVDNDYSGMGGADDAENELLWRQCYDEYCVLVNREGASYAMLLMLEVERMKYRYVSIDRGIELLHMMRDDEIVAMLQREGLRFSFNDKDRVSYFADLKRAKKKADSMLFLIRDKEALLQQVSGEAKGGRAITRQRFNDEIAVLSKSMGFKINRKETTTGEYASYICMYVSSYNQRKAKQDGGRTDNRPN